MIGLCLVCQSTPALAQTRLDTLRTNSRALLIRDGLSRFDWWVEPGPQPDTYHTNFPLVGGAVTFYAERDSLTVLVRPGEHRDFIVRVRDSIDVVTRVSAAGLAAELGLVEGDVILGVNRQPTPDTDPGATWPMP